MSFDRFFTPVVRIKNISTMIVRILTVDINPGQTVELFKSMNAPVELFEFQIFKALEKPYGDLYVEQELKKTIEIQTLCLVSFYYAKVAPANITSSNDPFPGSVPQYLDDETFKWVSAAGITVESPLVLSPDNVISIPPADGTTDGYLTKEDWIRFNASVKGDLRIWQYQDFPAAVASSVTLSAFENGTGLTFTSSWIIDGTAAVVLVSNNTQPPTTTLTFPANLLPSNRVSVTSHIGTTVVFNSAPDASLNVRVYYLISVPATVALPNDYQEAPKFLGNSSLDYLDDVYLNRNQDEDIYGEKTFEGDSIFNSGVQISTDAVDGYFLQSDGSGNASWAPVVASGSGNVNGASNIGTDGYGFFKQLVGDTLEFKNLAAGSTNIDVSADGYNVYVDINPDAVANTLDLDGYFYLSDDETVTGHTTFSPTTSTVPAFTIVPDGAIPTTNVSDGSVSVIGGVLYIYDATRAKWLAKGSPLQCTASRKQKTSSNVYLRTADAVPTNIAPFILPWDMTLIAMSASTDGASTWTAETHVGGVAVAGASLVVTAATSAFDATKNVDFAQGAAIQLFASGAKVPYPRGSLFFVRRVS